MAACWQSLIIEVELFPSKDNDGQLSMCTVQARSGLSGKWRGCSCHGWDRPTISGVVNLWFCCNNSNVPLFAPFNFIDEKALPTVEQLRIDVLEWEEVTKDLANDWFT